MTQLTNKEITKIKQLMGEGTSDPKILKQVETIIKNALGKVRPTGARPKMGSKGYGVKPKKRASGGRVKKRK